jgi:hypothetical protein
VNDGFIGIKGNIRRVTKNGYFDYSVFLKTWTVPFFLPLLLLLFLYTLFFVIPLMATAVLISVACLSLGIPQTLSGNTEVKAVS